MRFVSEIFTPASAWMIAAATVLGIIFILAFIFLRRVLRSRWFRIRDQRVQWIRQNWQRILSGEIPAAMWCCNKLDKQIVEELALDLLDVARAGEVAALQALFQNSGLLDRYRYEARKARGWRRRHAVLTLGRIRTPECTPVLTEILNDSSADAVIAAIRALGRLGTPGAGCAIIERVSRPLACLPEVIESALVACYTSDPAALLSATLQAGDALRPMLARVLAEVAVPGLQGDLGKLASDPDPEVRASAARILAVARPPHVTAALSTLAGDSEWFVRLRAMVGLRGLADPLTVPVLLRGLSDRNRLVRLRAASALAAIQGLEENILHLVRETGDSYALQALVSEFERSGKIAWLVERLGQTPVAHGHCNAILTAIRGGAVRLIVEFAKRHSDPHVQNQLRGILARSDDHVAKEYLRQFAPKLVEPQPVFSYQMTAGHNGSNGRTSADRTSHADDAIRPADAL